MTFRRPSGFTAFTTLWCGQMLSAVGTRMTNLAISIWVWQETGQATQLALLMAFAFGATVVVSPIAGSLIDRWDRRLTIVLSDAGSAVATLLLLAVFLTGSVSMWQLYLVNIATGAFLAFQLPAYSATITVMVEKGRYPRANAMMFVVRFFPAVLAPGLATTLLVVMDITVILVVDLLTFVVAIVAVFLVRIPATPSRESREGSAGRAGLWRDLWQDSLFGFRYLWRRRPLLGLESIMFAISLFAAIGFTLLIPLVLARSGDNEAAVGVVWTVGAIGGVAGAVWLGALPPTRHKMRRILLAILAFSVIGRILFGVGEAVVVWAAALLVVHLCIPFIDGYAQTIFQEKVQPEVQGRVFAARQFVEELTVPIGALVAGPVVDYALEPWMRPGAGGADAFGWLVGTGRGAGIGLMFVLVGVVGVFVAIAGYLSPEVRGVETLLPDHDAVPDQPASGRTGREPSDAPTALASN
jgi:MFS family permease